ncbi:uncharacterized protein LOC120333078 isoform X1 [Styela clava]
MGCPCSKFSSEDEDGEEVIEVSKSVEDDVTELNVLADEGIRDHVMVIDMEMVKEMIEQVIEDARKVLKADPDRMRDRLEDNDSSAEKDTKEKLEIHRRVQSTMCSDEEDAKKIGISWSHAIRQQSWKINGGRLFSETSVFDSEDSSWTLEIKEKLACLRSQDTICHRKYLVNGNIFYVDKEKRLDSLGRKTIHEPRGRGRILQYQRRSYIDEDLSNED